MTGTWEALVTGQADLAIGVGLGREVPSGVAIKELGTLPFCFAVAPHHPLAAAKEPLSDGEIVRHRAVAVADSARGLPPLTVNLLPGQDVLTVSDMLAKIDALTRGVGCGFVPVAMAREAIAAGRLVVKAVQRAQPTARVGYAWRLPLRREGAARKAEPGLALRWWLERLESATTRQALLDRHGVGRRHRRGRCCLKSGAKARRWTIERPREARPTSAASRLRRPACCTPVHWSPRSPRGSTRAPTVAAGWCGSKTSTRRATSPALPKRSSPSSNPSVCAPMAPSSVNRSAPRSTRRRCRALEAKGRAYPCACSRRDLALAVAAPAGTSDARAEAIYPGTCRAGLHGKAPRSVRLQVEGVDGSGEARVDWLDRRLGAQHQDVARAVGDFVLKRADGVFAYQLAVVVDDAEQGVTDVVRGEDLADSTARQILLQRLLGVATPRYLHTPLVRTADGAKLSKQTGATPLVARRSARGIARRRPGARSGGARHDDC